MARWTVYLRESAQGWEWSRKPDVMQWGFYKTKGLAISAARRSIPKVIGKSNPKDFEFIQVTTGDLETRIAQIKRATDAVEGKGE